MEESICVIMGDWTCTENGVWKFVLKQGVMARCVSIGGEKSFASLKSEIVKAFGVDTKRTSISISFWCEGETTVFTQTKMPPVLINSEAEFALYKLKVAQNGGLNLYITLRKLVDEEHEEPQSNDDIIRLEDEEFDLDSFDGGSYFEDATVLACVEKIESVHSRKKVKTMDNNRVDNLVTVDKNRISVDNIFGSVVEAIMKSMVDENKSQNEMDNNRGSFRVTTVDENLAESAVDKNACEVYAIDNHRVDNLDTEDQNRSASVEDDEATDVDMGAYSDDSREDTPDYDFDEWSEKINNDYPLNWDPYKVTGCTSNVQLLNSLVLGKRVMAVGQTSGTENTEVEDARRCSSWIGDDDFMCDGGPVIDENDPLLLNDAQPFLDNFGDEPTLN